MHDGRDAQGTHTPGPVDLYDLLVELHHEDDEEDDGDDHLDDGDADEASKPGRNVADEDDETEELVKWGWGEILASL